MSVLDSVATGASAGSVIPGWGTAAGAAVGLGVGLAQYYKGKQLEKSTVRPTYEIPQEVYQNQQQLDRMAQQGISAPSENKYFQEQQQNAAYGLNQIGSRKGGLAGVGNINSQLQQGNYNFLVADSEQRNKNMQAQMAGRQNLADYKGQEFQFNKLNPYYENVSKAQGLMGSGMQNIATQGGNLLYAAGNGYDANNQNKLNNYNNNPSNGVVGYNSNSQQVQAMPGVNPYNTNQASTAPLTNWGGGLVATGGFQSSFNKNVITPTQLPTVGYNVPGITNTQVGGLQASPSLFR